MKMSFIILLFFFNSLPINNNSAVLLEKIFNEIINDSLAQDFFKADGIFDNFKVDIDSVSYKQKGDYLHIPKVLYKYFLDTNDINTPSKQFDYFRQLYLNNLDCTNYSKILIERDKFKYFDSISNIKMCFSPLNDSIITIYFCYKLIKIPEHKYDLINYYLLLSKDSCKILSKSRYIYNGILIK